VFKYLTFYNNQDQYQYQDHSLLLEIKELYQLFNIEKFDTNNIKMIENSLNEMENVNESEIIHFNS
jgi:hypothetical protein